MIEHKNRHKKPFEIGQLVKYVERLLKPADYGLDIVLDLEWSDKLEEWKVYALSQRTGRTEWCWAHNFRTVGKTNDIS
jgi:hypothetical protein